VTPPARLDVRLVTATERAGHDAESPRVVEALRALGLRAELAAWDDARVDWAGARAHVIRSTWNYSERLAAFLAWTERVAAVSALWNPAPVVRANVHKRYLLELAARGVPAVPTALVERAAPRGLEEAARAGGWSDVVVKPAVGAGARGALRTRAGAPEGETHLAALLAQGDALVQPYLASIGREGERSLVYFGGALRHATRKLPGAGDFRVQEHLGGATRPYTATAAERAVAEAALAAVSGTLLYARVDLVPVDGAPHLSELELVEPSLYLEHLPGGHAAFARAIADAVCSGPAPSPSSPSSKTSSSSEASAGTPTRSGKP
jgi:glutathione synthase/RimK-type ligase-like ATP-grasp enzyme